MHVSHCVLAVSCTHLHRKAARVDGLLACADGPVGLSEEPNVVFFQVPRASILCSSSGRNCTHLYRVATRVDSPELRADAGLRGLALILQALGWDALALHW